VIHSDLYLEFFYSALRIRLIEERIIELYPSDKIQSPVHLSIGQESVAVGICHSLLPLDLLYTTYRSHAFYLAKGGDIRKLFAELYGKVTGCCQGKGGSMHLAAPDVGFMGTSAVVASAIPQAVGSALATKYLKKNQVNVVVFGDGAMDQGVYHESLNFAALHKLPVVFIFENNGLAVHSPIESRHSFSTLDHVKSYGIPAMSIAEGYDFEKVHLIVSDIIAHVRDTCVPYFIEIRTYRYKEHVGVAEDYDAGYRSRESLKNWQEHDPLIIDKDLIARYRPAIEKEIDEAVQFAEESPLPDKRHLLEDVI
jgi:pyruvate dehydrogenase E1 component alpha subunit